MADGVDRACSSCGRMWSNEFKFCASCGTALTAGPEPELRQLTIMFCDLVGSTHLSTRLDPEDLLNVINGFHQLCERVIPAAGGHVLRFVGDGVLASFGAPVALDDAATRSIHAARELVLATEAITTAAGEKMESRAGIHTGTVVLARTGTGSGQVPLDVIGEAANIAARLQGLAEPGEVVVSQDTAALVDGSVTFVNGVDADLKGIDWPVRTYRVGELVADVDALRRGARQNEARLVGREAELNSLLDRCRAADAGVAQLVAVVGEPGIGKTRLMREMRDSTNRPAGVVLTMRGLQDRTATPFAPVRELVEQQSDHFGSGASLLLALIREINRAENPEHRRRQTIERFCGALRDLSDDNFVLLLLDDLQWFDPSTIDLLRHLGDELHDCRLAVLATARPEWTQPWADGPTAHTLTLGRFSAVATRALLADFGINDPELVETVVERSEGVPLFLQELARQHDDNADAPLEVPRTVNDVLRGRLDRLGAGLDLVRTCSVLGRDIDVEIAAAMLDRPEDSLRSELRSLTQSNVLTEVDEGARFSFSHVLLRDCAYGTLLRSKRQELHEAAATLLESRVDDDPGLYVEQVARHWVGADQMEAAYRAWARAGQLAAERVALEESLTHYDEATSCLLAMDPSAERDRREARLVFRRAPVVVRLHGGGHESLEDMCARADELSQGDIDPMYRSQLIRHLFSVWMSRPDLTTAMKNVDRLLAAGDAAPALRPMNLFTAGSTLYLSGDPHGAIPLLEQAAEDLAADPNPERGAMTAWALGLLGDMAADSDRQRAEDYFAQSRAAIIDRPAAVFDHAWLDHVIAKMHARFGEFGQAQEFASRSSAAADRFGFAQLIAHCQNLLAWAAVASIEVIDLREGHEQQNQGSETSDGARSDSEAGETGDTSRLLDIMCDTIALMETCGSATDSSLYMLLASRELRRHGRMARADAMLADAQDYIDRTGERLHQAAVHAERSAAEVTANQL